MIDDCDGHAYVMHERDQKARKPHRCTECGRAINPGETYRSERTVFDGRASSHKTCAHCMKARGWLYDNCGGFAWGLVREDISEHFYRDRGNAPEVREIRLLAQGMRAKWARVDGRLWPVPTQRSLP